MGTSTAFGGAIGRFIQKQLITLLYPIKVYFFREFKGFLTVRVQKPIVCE